jgi:hypothetical protein
MEAKPWKQSHGSKAMEAKPWKQSHGSKAMEAKSWKQSRGSEGGQGDIGNLAIHNHASTCSAVLVGSVAAGGFSGRITSASLS